MPEKSASIRTSPRPGGSTFEARNSIVLGDANQTEIAGRSPANVDDIAISPPLNCPTNLSLSDSAAPPPSFSGDVLPQWPSILRMEVIHSCRQHSAKTTLCERRSLSSYGEFCKLSGLAGFYTSSTVVAIYRADEQAKGRTHFFEYDPCPLRTFW